jgi:hypothetical protein
MARFEIPGNPIHVAFGHDLPMGVFLSVVDNRLKWSSSASQEVNAAIEKIGVQDGGGSYFEIHTGQHGFGIRVDDETMATFLRRFGVSEEQIANLPLTL